LDIDGTLMGNSKDSLQRNFDVIQKVRSLGHLVFINTGRSTAYLPENIDVSKYFDGVISGAGARIVTGGKEIFRKTMELCDIKEFCEYGLKNQIIGVLEGIYGMFFVGNQDEVTEPWVYINSENISRYINEDLKIEKFTVLGTAPQDLCDILDKNCVIIQHEGYAEIIRKDCSKARAMEFTAQKLGIDASNCVAMGDSLNDFDMIESSGIGVAMGNAVPEIKNIADMVTEDVDCAGVAGALIKIFNLKE